MGVVNFLKHVRKGDFRQAFMGNRGKWSHSGTRRLAVNKSGKAITESAKRTRLGKLKNWIGLHLFGPRLRSSKFIGPRLKENERNGRTMLGKTKNYIESALRKRFTGLRTRKSRNDRNHTVQTAAAAPPPPLFFPRRVQGKPLQVGRRRGANTPLNNGYGQTWGAFNSVKQPKNVAAAREAQRKILPPILEPNPLPNRSSLLKFANSVPLLGGVTKFLFPSSKPSTTLTLHKRPTKLGAKPSTAKSPSQQNAKFPNSKEHSQLTQIAGIQQLLLPLLGSLDNLKKEVTANGLQTDVVLFDRKGHKISIDFILQTVNTLKRRIIDTLQAFEKENRANFKKGVASINETLRVLNIIFEKPGASELFGLGLTLGTKLLTIGPIVSSFMNQDDVENFVELSKKLIT